jgi:hypothetical protein
LEAEVSRWDKVTLTFVVHRETDKAILVSDDGDRKKAEWLPLSQIKITREWVEGDNEGVEVEVPQWLAEEKGFY